LQPSHSGKVRDLFDLGDQLLMVATDRISAYDVILGDPIPGKGTLLTRMSLEWFALLEDVVPNHLISAKLADFPAPFCNHPELAGRSMLIHKAQRVDAECIVRGYITGSGWRDYQRGGEVCGITLPQGLQESQRFATPLFTPSTKADEGHDENISMAVLEKTVGKDVAQQVCDVSLRIFERASAHALERGIILADTKFEFGFLGDTLILIDEVLSPDSSRFWPSESYEVGQSQQSFDKQFMRDWLDQSGWDHAPPAPHLPDDIVQKTQDRYTEALRRLFPQAVNADSAGVAS
jgi:phosphoribosylaminoimidazole-succinocarboxamide synthase